MAGPPGPQGPEGPAGPFAAPVPIAGYGPAPAPLRGPARPGPVPAKGKGKGPVGPPAVPVPAALAGVMAEAEAVAYGSPAAPTAAAIVGARWPPGVARPPDADAWARAALNCALAAARPAVTLGGLDTARSAAPMPWTVEREDAFRGGSSVFAVTQLVIPGAPPARSATETRNRTLGGTVGRSAA